MSDSETALALRPQTALSGYVPPPSKVEFEAMISMANTLAKAQGFLPAHFFGQPYKILAAILYGRDLGISATNALQHIIVIEGKATADAQLIGMLVRRAGHQMVDETTDTASTVRITRNDGTVHEATFTIQDAQRAGLVRAGGAWTKYPAAMLYARALTACARKGAQDALMGTVYTPEELGAEIVGEGGEVAMPTSTPIGEIPTEGDVTMDGEVINPSPQSRAAVQQAQDERPGTREVGTPASPVERVAPPATTPASAEPNGKRRGRPLGSKNHKAPTPFGGTQAEPEDALEPLRRELFAIAARLLKLQYIEKASDLPPSEQWEAKVNETLAVYIARKRGTDVKLADLDEDSLRECIMELQGFVDGMTAPSDAQLSHDPDPDEQVIPVPQHKPIVRNAVAAPRRSPANEATQIDPQAALARARALADLRNRTTALLATREGLIQLTAKDEDRLRLQADTVMEKVAQNAFQVAIKNLDTEQLELLVERAKAASAPQ